MTASTEERLNDIAIVGMAGRFPGAADVEQFWRNIRDGVESITFFTDEELLQEGVDPALLQDPAYVKAASLLDGIESFDASFFGYSPREAETMDPQHRLFLETAWTALERAGYNSETYPGLISVFAGAGFNRYLLFNLLPNQEVMQALGEGTLMVGNDKDFMTSRTSYKLGLKGMSVSVQCACSTSLVAIHMAAQSLLNGECDMALAGGVSVAVPQKTGYLFREGGITSNDGHTRTFDADSHGTVFGSGVGIVVLKRLEDALLDGDQIYAVIKGSAVNNDGTQKVSFTAPSIEGQAAAVAEALAISGVEPETIGYIEAHGTGTSLGDPIEMAALHQAFADIADRQKLIAIGSVKTNVGHLDIAAGVAGFIKTAMALKHKQLPPSLHYQKPNPRIDFEHSPFYVNTDLQEWETDDVRRAAVSSFGFGGTNAHAVLEEAPELEASSESRPWQLLMLSAKTAEALEQATDNLKEHLKAEPDLNLADAAYTLQVGRRSFPHRRMLVVEDVQDAVGALEIRDPKRVLTGVHDETTRQVVFMFPGQGGQHIQMGRDLYETEPLFRENIDRCCDLLRKHVGIDLRDVLYPEGSYDEEAMMQKLNRPSFAHPAIFMVEYSLAQLLMEWGIKPHAIIGHSLGEYAAACLSGVFSLEDALTIVVRRAQLVETQPGGAMMAVYLPEAELQPHLSDRLSMATVNGPSHCVVSGPVDQIDALEAVLTAKDITCARVAATHAFHSHMMAPIADRFAEVVRAVKRNTPQIPFISSVTGTWITTEDATDPRYWARHLCNTVRFSDGILEASKDPQHILLEVGPGKTLNSFALHAKYDDAQPRVVLTTMRHRNDDVSDVAFLLGKLGQLWLSGVGLDWEAFYADEFRHRVLLPTYPFQRQRYWLDGHGQSVQAAPVPARQASLNPRDWFQTPIWKQAVPPTVQPFAGQQHWLIFLDSCSVGEQLAKKLVAAGQEVTTVTAGAQYEQLEGTAYALQPAADADYERLLADLRAAGRMPERVVHLWSVSGEAPTSLAEAQNQGLYSLLALAKALGKQAVDEPVDLLVAATGLFSLGAGDALMPEKASVLAPCKVIPQEYPNLSCRAVDLHLPGGNHRKVARLVEQLLTELQADAAEHFVAWRGAHRWVQTYEPLTLDASQQRNGKLRKRGSYLVTGAFTRVGRALATYLAKKVQARLVLAGTESLPARDAWAQWLADHEEQDHISLCIRDVQRLEIIGAEVQTVTAEAADADQLQAAVEAARAAFGTLHGVLHAEGTYERVALRAISEVTAADCSTQIRSKADAALSLQKVLADEELDFVLLPSSLSAVLGGTGMVADSAAHLVLDAYAQQGNGWSDTPWITVNRDVEDLENAEELIRYALTFDNNLPLVVYAKDLNEETARWAQGHDGEQPPQGEALSAAHVRPHLHTAYAAPSSDGEKIIVSLWEELLGIEGIGVHDDFFELGGNSLLATKLMTRLHDSFQVDLALRVIFEASTVADLSRVVQEAIRVETPAAEIGNSLPGSKSQAL